MSDTAGSLPTEGALDVESGRVWRGLLSFGFVLGQLLALVIVVRQFQIESSAFLRLFVLTVVGFAVHYFLPQRLRLPFFVVLSVAGILMVLGVGAGAALMGLGLVLIGTCHLPVGWPLRLILLFGLAALLALMRVHWVSVPVSDAVWPILGSMFMFRLIVYVYDLRHDKTPPDFWSSMAYFFMLPNVCFPFFPVIDYKTFRRGHYADDANVLYQHGINWIVRGIVHLVLYRVVYYYWTLAPHEVVDADTLVQFLVANFGLYLRISGYFHLIVGMLYLFGFKLPETHYRYVLSSSFTEFWRRINIYWKDFMMKIFYFPLYFSLKRFGTTTALVIATGLVFMGTWIAHSYQWFWLRGEFPVTWQDGLFWGVLGILVIANSLYEIRYGRKRSLDSSSWSVRETVALGLKTVCTFLAVIVLWSLWTSESFASWLSMWSFMGDASKMQPNYLMALVAIVFGAAILFGRSRKGSDRRSPVLFEWAGIEVTGVTLRTLALLAVLFIGGLPQFYGGFGASTANLVMSLRRDGLSRVDTAALQRGYYEELTRVNRFNSQLWEVYMKKPVEWLGVTGSGLTRFTGDFQKTELIPSFRSTTSYGVITTNAWGMRDQEYEKLPADGTFRFAVLGASTLMGWGVEDDETFETLVENRLNANGLDERWSKYELLNFGVPGLYPLQQRTMLDRALEFGPHSVMYIATGRELSRAAYYLAEAVGDGMDIPYQELALIAEEAGVGRVKDQSERLRRLEPFEHRILTWLYSDIVRRTREAGATPLLVFLPQLEEGAWEEETAPTLTIARDAGFRVMDLSGVFSKSSASELRIAEWDEHPNALGHRLIAEALFESLSQNWNVVSDLDVTEKI